MPNTNQVGKHYLPGLDGLRAISVLAVIAYHMNFIWGQGGFLGVVVFFVLSGYLITSLLLREWEQKQKITLRNFWIRRIRRLFPALLFMIVMVMAYITIFDPSVVLKARSDFIASLIFVSNWWSIFHHVSYFDNFGTSSPFKHLWSLAVEEQFYMFWPFLLVTLLIVFRKKRTLLFFMIGMGFISALLMAFLYHPGIDPSRAYYGTDTRIFSLVIGAALAIAWPKRISTILLKRHQTILLDLIGMIGLITLLWFMANVNQYSSFLYRGGMLLISFVCLPVIAALTHTESLLSKIIGNNVLRWIGARSYGIYLWQYPIIILTTQAANSEHLLPKVIQFLTILMVANISWRFIEKPIMNGALKKMFAKMKAGEWSYKHIRPVYRVVTVISVLMLCICSFGMTSNAYSKNKAVGVSIKDVHYLPEKNIKAIEVLPPNLVKKPPEPKTVTNPKTANDKTTTETNPSKQSSKTENQTSEKGSDLVTMIGDSILADVAPFIKKKIPGSVIDAKVSRQFFQAIPVIHQLKKDGLLGNIVVIELGTNGTFTKKQMNDLLLEIGNTRTIIFINTRVPDPWEKDVNSKFAAIAAASAKIKVLDWFQLSSGKPDYFYKDQVHPNSKGAQVYAQMIAEAVGK